MPHFGHVMHWVGNFGDALVLLPASLGLVALLFGVGSRRDGAAYLAALAACLIGVLAAKFAFAACGDTVVFGIESPSGHAAFAATFYGSLAVLLGAGRPTRRRLALYGGAAALIVLIGVSRVAIDVHTVADVLVGFAIGAVAVALFVGLRRAPERLRLSRRDARRLWPFAALFALCWVAFAGRWVAEPYIDRAAEHVGARLHLCQ